MKLNYPFRFSAQAFLMLTAFFMVFACKQEPKKNEVVQNYGTGETSRRYYEINGKKEGIMTDYYPDGSLMGERVFENDIQVGKTILYYKSGKIKEVQYYLDGKIHGGDTVFYEDGKPQFVLTFTKGIKDGYVRKWGPDGTLIYEAKYSNDTLVEVKGEAVRPVTIN